MSEFPATSILAATVRPKLTRPIKLTPPALWTSVARYLYTSSQSMEDLRLLQDLPPSLATRLAITVHRRIVVRLPLFNTLSDLALLSVLARLHPIIFVPGQVCTTARKALAASELCPNIHHCPHPGAVPFSLSRFCRLLPFFRWC